MYFILKRLIDLFIAGSVLLVLAFPLLVIAILLRLTGEGEIFYRQERLGLHNRMFGVWKFATMLKNSPNAGTITVKGDPRILPLGRFLRDTKINELPQLWNIITGDMSIVGPRPLTQQAFDLYPEEFKPLVYQSRPGLTGIGSVVFRDEERILAESGKDRMVCYREDIMPIKGALEAWYLTHRSLTVDLRIIMLTAIAILNPGNRLHEKWFRDLPATTSAATLQKSAASQPADLNA